MNFKDTNELEQFHREASSSFRGIREQLCRRMGIDGSYYEGVQWLNQIGDNFGRVSVQRRFSDYGPDSRKLRATFNETSRLTQKVAAGTHPQTIEVSAIVPEFDSGIEAVQKARASECACNAQIEYSKLQRAADLANFRRWVFGMWMCGLRIETGPYGACLKAFDADPTCLILEPSCQALELAEHPYVGYEDVWTLDRIKRVLGVTINPDEAMTVGQLLPMKMEMYAISSGKLFTRYANSSKAKAARVVQYHFKNGDQRFDQWCILVESGKDKVVWVNEKNQQCPFGGNGLPFVLLHGFPRSDTMFSWGAPAQIKDHQDKLNLTETQKQRIVRNAASPKAIVDKRWFGVRVNDDDIARQMNNAPDRPIIGSGGDRVQNVSPPQWVQPPGPPPFLAASTFEYKESMRENIHKAPGNFGTDKSHVPYQTTRALLDDADEVASVRGSDDRRNLQALIGVMFGTMVGLAKERNPATLSMLRDEGFGPEEFAVIAQENPDDPSVKFEIDESTYRHESLAAKKDRLDKAASMAMVTPDQYQRSLAGALGMALTDEDRQMTTIARKIAYRVLMGEEYEPTMLGQWTQTVIDQLTLAQFDRRALLDPATRQRLQQAVLLQRRMQQQEAIMADPKLQLEMAQMESDKAEESAEAGSGGAEPNQSASVADILDALSGSGAANAGGQPVPA